MWGCVPGQMSVMDKFKMIKEAGFDGIEIDSGMDRDEVLEARDATGLQIPSVVCSTHWQQPLSDPNPGRAPGRPGGIKNGAARRQGVRLVLGPVCAGGCQEGGFV